ncbi:hypothetical protein [Kitasatospora purpeofusca]|uniref:hypothetical protein n=1 Tax=Kitasatospora purpeofusca TaxID=67352 RepID=UPI003866342F|nr:hypothetical protein OIP63_28640 [Kitasatospora purpeofusca]
MSDRTISTPELLEADADSAPGFCRHCGAYGAGREDGVRDASSVWIVDHAGCAVEQPPAGAGCGGGR